MKTASALKASAETDPGRQRDVNEDRVHADIARGVFMVIDGVGGHAAGGKAADIALRMMRTRLERETRSIADRIREAIATANNEIHRAARLRAEWKGMACVLTVAVVDDLRAIVGHVGDTRLYKLRDGAIAKVTRDHSPVGEREDAGEIAELDAMHHPRRNEVYRDVGSDPHRPGDRDFIDLHEIAFEPDAALLLCSDGLTDVIESTSVQQIVHRFAGRPERVAKALIDAANAAGGKDNVSVVYVEGEQFASRVREVAEGAAEITRRLAPIAPNQNAAAEAPDQPPGTRRSRHKTAVRLALVALLGGVTAAAVTFWWQQQRRSPRTELAGPIAEVGTIAVGPGESIATALQRAAAGTVVIVEPGEYRETIALKTDVRVVSRVPRGAIIRLPGSASEASAAVLADGVQHAGFAGFRIVGDAATPLGTGILARSAEVAISDVEVTGASDAAIAFADRSTATLIGSDIHDNPGAALSIRAATARITHNVFERNGASEHAHGAFAIAEGADVRFAGNVFPGVSNDAFGTVSDSSRAALARDNWFPAAHEARSSAVPTPPRGRRSR
jgi:serine/threonine protein phosphatase PrpC